MPATLESMANLSVFVLILRDRERGERSRLNFRGVYSPASTATELAAPGDQASGSVVGANALTENEEWSLIMVCQRLTWETSLCTRLCTVGRVSRVRRHRALKRMSTLTRFGIRRILTGWALFGGGFGLILWLHTFSDRAPHRMILPLLLLLWVALGVCVWDGCKSFALWKRIAFILTQAVTAAIACVSLISHFLYHSP